MKVIIAFILRILLFYTQVDDYKKIIEEKDREIETLLTVFKEEVG